MRCSFPDWTTLIAALFVLSSCSVGRTIETNRFTDVSSKGMSIPYSLPKGLLSFTVTQAATPIIVFNGVKLVPDDQARYVANLKTSIFSSDDYKFVVEDGLLKTVSNTTTDATPAVVSTLTTGISGILKREERSAARIARATEGARVDTFLIDPFKHRSNPRPHITAQIKDIRGEPVGHISEYRECPQGSVCFPLLVTVVVKISVEGASSEFEAVVPDPRQVAAVDVNRFACDETKSSVTLNKGVLTNYDVKKGSEVAGCLSIPLDIISAIIRAPIDAITGQSARIDSNKTLVTAQKLLIAEQLELIKKQKELLDATE